MSPLVLYLNVWAFEWHTATILDANDRFQNGDFSALDISH